jgi:hypothetical protein
MMPTMPEFVLTAEAVPFIEADTNDDRLTTQAESQAWVEHQWAIMSQGATGISRLQFEAWMQALFGPVEVTSQFGPLSFDRDMDRQITDEEFRTEIARRFSVRDANQNGVVERGEMFLRLPRPPQMMRPPRGGPPGGGPPGGGPPGGGGGRPGGGFPG